MGFLSWFFVGLWKENLSIFILVYFSNVIISCNINLCNSFSSVNVKFDVFIKSNKICNNVHKFDVFICAPI